MHLRINMLFVPNWMQYVFVSITTLLYRFIFSVFGQDDRKNNNRRHPVVVRGERVYQVC